MGKEKEVAKIMIEYARRSYDSGFFAGFLTSMSGMLIVVLIKLIMTT